MAFKSKQEKPKATHRPAAPGAAPYDDSKHPRAGKGTGGGRFTSTGASSSASRRSSNVKDPVKAVAGSSTLARAVRNASSRKVRRTVARAKGMPARPVADGTKPLPKRKRTKGLPPMVIAASDQQPLEAANDPARLAQMIAQAKQLGVTHWRLVMEWGHVVHDGQLDFSQFDPVVDAMKAAGISTELAVLGTAQYHPQWDQQLSWQNADPAKARWFAQQVSAHYSGRVSQFSAWNEPNLGATFLENGDVDPAKYRRLYQAMRDGFRAAQPGAEVGFGEVAPVPGADAWLHKALRGVKDVDRVTLHTYQAGDESPRNYSTQPDTLGINALDYAKAIVAAAGAKTRRKKDSPIAITEMGYTTATPDRALRLPMAMSEANSRDARQFTLYQLFDRPAQPSAAAAQQVGTDEYGNAVMGMAGGPQGGSWNTSLIGSDGTPTPAYYAAQRRARELRARPVVRAKAASAKKRTAGKR